MKIFNWHLVSKIEVEDTGFQIVKYASYNIIV